MKLLRITILICLIILGIYINTYAHVKIGVIDTGFSRKFDFQNMVGEGYNYVSENTDVTDNIGHGTFVTNIILKHTKNAEIIPLKCVEKNIYTDPKYLLSAIYDAVDLFECDVLNISRSMLDTKEIREAIDYALDNGVIIVAAAGNDGEFEYKKDRIYYPAGYDRVVGVGSVDANNVVSSFSQKNSSVFVVARGEDVYSYTNDGKYKKDSGTSFSAPYISAVAAMKKSENPDITPDEFKEYLQSITTDLGKEGYDTEYGHGLINIQNYQFER